jgi:predicted RNase H-like nuclease (RuvC/YqgF family)
MNSKAKAIVLVILILISLAIAGGGFYLYQQEHVRNIDLQVKFDDLTAKQKLTQAKLFEAQKSLSIIEAKLKDATSQIDALTSQLQQEKASKEEALSKMEQMKSDLDQQKESRSDLENKLSKAQDDLRTIQSKLSKIEAGKKALEMRIKELEAKSNVELGKIVVSPEAASAKPLTVLSAVNNPESTAKGLGGKVLVLNKEYNFVVINLGSKDGVVINDEFSVYQGNKNIGDVKVEKVQDTMSAAGFVSDKLKNMIKEGDKVVRKS